MLIDDFLPQFDVKKKYSNSVHAPAGVVYDRMTHLDLSRSALVRILFRLRGLPSTALTLDGLEEMKFVRLGEVPGRELLFGVVGRFWSLRGDLKSVDIEGFRSFSEEGYARAVWNFSVDSIDKNHTLLSTETRVQCLDSVSAQRFRAYWTVVSPFSGWIRKEALDIIKKESEMQAPTKAQ